MINKLECLSFQCETSNHFQQKQILKKIFFICSSRWETFQSVKSQAIFGRWAWSRFIGCRWPVGQFVFQPFPIYQQSIHQHFETNIVLSSIHTLLLFDLFSLCFLSSSKSKLGGCAGDLKPNAKTRKAQKTTPKTGKATWRDTTSVTSILKQCHLLQDTW